MTAGVPKHRVVVIDDDRGVRESIETFLTSVGYEPLIFSCAEEFLESHTLLGATCVITDVRMPGIDGLELQRQIKLERPNLPIIFVSAHVDAETRQRAFAEGAYRFFYKPFDTTELLNALRDASSKYSC